MEFRTISLEDLENIQHLQPEGWPDITVPYTYYIKSPFCYPILVEVDNRIAGIGASIHFGHTAWIGHIIVDSHLRKRGIGYCIVSELLIGLKKFDIETCSLSATHMGQSIYQKAGFRVVAEYSFMTKTAPWKVPPVCDNIFPFIEAYRPEIVTMDRQVSGENRERVLSSYLDDSLVYIEDNQVQGYYLPDLNEGLIIANTREAGIALMKEKYSTTDRAVLPSDNQVGIHFLLNNGFIFTERKGIRMTLGNDIHWQPSAVYSRIGGNMG